MRKFKLRKLSTKFLGQEFIYLDTVDSTQTYVKNLDNLNKAKNGTVVFAEKQTAGIGTHDRKWYTGKGDNIAFTFVLYPHVEVSKLEKLTFMIAVSMVQTLQELYNVTLKIKIPNDLYYNNKKVGGILTESNTKSGVVEKIFIGIGLNVNQAKFPGTLDEIATSLIREFNIKCSREEILAKFFEIFEERYLKMLEGEK